MRSVKEIQRVDRLNYKTQNNLKHLKVNLSQIASALQFLHDENKSPGVITHNDLKLQNILLDEDFIVKLTDFGGSTIIKDGKCIGDVQETKEYKPKERIEGKQLPSPSHDVFSYGVCLFIAMTRFKLDGYFYEYCEDRKHILFGEVTQIYESIRSGEPVTKSGNEEKELQILFQLFEVFQNCCFVNCNKRITSEKIDDTFQSFIDDKNIRKSLSIMFVKTKREQKSLQSTIKNFKYSSDWIDVEQVNN